MIVLVSGATSFTERDERGKSPHLGALIGPRSRNNVTNIIASGKPWAADNDCFSQLYRELYLAMLRMLHRADTTNLKFVTAPDVLCNAERTHARLQLWKPTLRYYGLPIGFVGQNGLEHREIPWDDFEALFIGGDTEWKLGPYVRNILVPEAKARGKWVHMGRVNSMRRLWYAEEIGCDSVDGSGFSKYPSKCAMALNALDDNHMRFVDRRKRATVLAPLNRDQLSFMEYL